MDKLSELYGMIDRLNWDELDQLSAYIERKRMQPQIIDETPHERAAAIMAAFAEMREGLSNEELDEMIAVMNLGYSALQRE